MNKIFVIEGTDGSGKQTQVEMLYARLIMNNIETLKASFPNYDSQSSGPVKEYLSGNISKNPNDISAKAASLFYAVDRYITYKENLEKFYNDEETVILLDRYVSSNLLHQGAKILNKYHDYSKLDEFSDWLYNIEYNDLELPKANKTFFLYLPIEESLKAMENRENKFSHNEKKDIHESNREHLEYASKAGYYLAKKLGFEIINCMKEDGTRKSILEINDEIFNIIIKNI